MKELKTTITAEEKTNILSMFSQLLKERPNTSKDTRNANVKNTIDEACFISKGLDGEADGIFFPNSIFEINNSKKDFICLCIYDGKPSICQTYSNIKSLEGKIYFTSLESLIYSDEEIEARKEFNVEKRKSYYDRVQEILSDEQPYTFLYFPYTNIALSKRFENVKAEKAGITYNFIEWYVKKANQKYHQLTN